MMRVQTANDRARVLLTKLLTEEQREDYFRTGTFVVVGSEGHSFRLSGSDWVGNVTHFDEFGPIADYCATPRLYDSVGYRLPMNDVLIGQMLALKTDEKHFITTANKMCVYRREATLPLFASIDLTI